MSLLIISILFPRNIGLRWLADFLPRLKSFSLELRLSTPKGLLAHPWAQGWLVPWWQVRTNWFLGAFTRNPRNSAPGPLETLETLQTPPLVYSTPCFTRRAPGPQVSPPKISHNCITFARMVLDHRKQTNGRTYSPQNSFAVKSIRSEKAYIRQCGFRMLTNNRGLCYIAQIGGVCSFRGKLNYAGLVWLTKLRYLRYYGLGKSSQNTFMTFF